jgi:hypothetical protein
MNMQQKFDADIHLKSKNKNGNIDTVMVGEKVTLETLVGELIPRYTLDDEGRKKESPVKFYKTGELKSVPLEEPTIIPTSVGNIKSELLIFYKNGNLWRTFPLNGQVSGFWTEENEYELAEAIDIPTSLGTLKVKPIYVQFYESGALESILFWPNERIKINTTVGEVLIHKGICFHENGNLKGFEPVEEISVESPIGTLNAFDPDPNGIHAESHSINFAEDGSIQSLITTSNQITVIKDGMKYKTFAPKLLSSYCNENAFFISPLKILFERDSISFNNNNEPVESLSRFLQYEISAYVPEKPISCFGCE